MTVAFGAKARFFAHTAVVAQVRVAVAGQLAVGAGKAGPAFAFVTIRQSCGAHCLVHLTQASVETWFRFAWRVIHFTIFASVSRASARAAV